MLTRKIGGANRSQPETEWTWNSADKGADVALSESDKLASFAGATAQAVRGPAIVGMRYFMIQVASASTGTLTVGVANGSQSLSAGLASTVNSIAMYEDDIWYNNSPVVSNVGVNLNSQPTLMFAVNSANFRVWIGNRSSGTWFNSGDPAAGTGYVGTLSGTLYPAASSGSQNPDAAVRAISYPLPPTGFSRL